MKSKKNKLDILIQIASNFPKKKNIFSFLLFIKILPNILITHDWNLNNKKSIFHYIRIFTLVDFFYIKKEQTKYKIYIQIYQIIIFILTFISILFIIIIYYLNSAYKKNIYFFFSYQKMLIKISSLFLFYIFYFLNQYIYSIFIEIIYYNNKNIIYYISLICIVYLFCFINMTSFWINTLIYIPLFVENNTYFSFNIINSFNELFLLPLYQIFIQLEFHIEFNKILIFKNIVRFIYICLYIFFYFKSNYLYIRKYYYFIFVYIQSMCLISILIEWATYYDKKNDLIILIKDNSTKILKLILECTISLAFTEFFFIKEKRRIKRCIVSLSNTGKNNYVDIILLFNLIYYKDNENELKEYIDMIFNIDRISNDSLKKKNIEKINKIIELNINDFLTQKEQFFLEEKLIDDLGIHSFRNKFPCLYNYIKYKIKMLIDQNKYIGKEYNYIQNIFIHIIYIYTFEKNFFECLYLLELIKKTKLYNNSFLFKCRLKYFYYQIKQKYYFNLIYNFSGHLQSKKLKINKNLIINYDNYKDIKSIIISNEFINKTLKSYINIMNLISNNSEIQLNEYYQVLKNFNNTYKITKKYIDRILNKKREYLEINQLTLSYNIFQKFFNKKNYENSKTNISNLSNNMINIINENKDTYILIINVEKIHETFKFHVEYFSKNFICLIKYSIEELLNSSISDLFPKNYSKHYNKMFVEIIENNKTNFEFENFYFLDKEKYLHKFKLICSVLFFFEGIKIYITAIENDINTCEILTNKNGKINFISRNIESIFFMKSKSFYKNKLYFEDLFKISINKKLNNCLLENIYHNMLILLKDTSITDISQKIGDEEHSKLISKINHTLLKIQNLGLNYLQIIFDNEKEIINKNKEYYRVKITLYDPINNKCFYNILNYLNNYSNVSKLLSPILKSNDDLNSSHSSIKIPDFSIKNDLIFKITSIKTLSITLLNIFYDYKLKDKLTEIENNDINNSFIDQKEQEKKNILNEKEETSTLKETNIEIFSYKKNSHNLLDLISIKVPNIKRYHITLFILIVICFVFFVLFSLIYKIISINNQDQYIDTYINLFLLQSTILNFFNEILFHQLHLNKLQNVFFTEKNYFKNFQNKIINQIKDLINYQTRMKNFNRFKISKTKILFETIFNKKFEYFEVNLDGFKYISTNNTLDISYLATISNLIKHEIDNLNIFYNNSDYYFIPNYNEDKLNYYAKKSYILIIDNYLYIFIYYLGEYINMEYNIILIKNLYGNFFDVYLTLIISCGFIIFSFIYVVILILITNYSFVNYFLVYNYLLFFHLYLNTKTQNIVNYFNKINFQFEDRDKKLYSLYNVILLQSNDSLFKLKNLIKNQVYERINQIRIIPFKLKNDKNKHKTKFLNNNNISDISLISSKSIKSGNKKKIKNFSNKKSSNFNPINSTNLNLKTTPNKTNNEINLSTKLNISNNSNSKNNLLLNLKNENNSSLNQLNVNLNNNSQINNITNNANLSNIIFEQSGHKLLAKANNYWTLKILMPLILIIFLMINLYQVKRVKNNNKISKLILKDIDYLFNTIFFLMQGLQIHLLSILRNENIYFKYNGYGYFGFCSNIYKFTGGVRDVFYDSLKCFDIYEKNFEDLSNGKFNSKFKNLIIYFNQLNSEQFCEYYPKMVIESQTHSNYFLNFLIEQKEENISYYCKEIGNFTSKGLLTIIKSIYNELKNLHNDFLDDKNRTKEKNLEKINNKNLIYIQKTIYYIFDKLPITFAYIILEDYKIFKDYVIFYSYIFCFIQIFSMLLIALYIILETSNYILEEKNIYVFIERLGNTILF